VGTPNPYHKLHEYMDGDDVGWPSLSRFGWETKPIWAYLIVILFSPFGPVSLLFYLFEIIYVKQFDLMGRAQQRDVLGFTIYMFLYHFVIEF